MFPPADPEVADDILPFLGEEAFMARFSEPPVDTDDDKLITGSANGDELSSALRRVGEEVGEGDETGSGQALGIDSFVFPIVVAELFAGTVESIGMD